jgi:hypothetical protein
LRARGGFCGSDGAAQVGFGEVTEAAPCWRSFGVAYHGPEDKRGRENGKQTGACPALKKRSVAEIRKVFSWDLAGARR